jgi:1-aminocyclopropane-1-carboxylate deaminase/D-cysteine desulfhydrase-like pyridoxal-dependent ACC family enzyme
MITEELVKLSTKTVEELKLIRSEMNEVCDYNQKWYKKLYDEKYGSIDINGDLTKIFEEVWNELKNKNG